MKRNSFARGEFMEFMDKFLRDHPEVVRDQQRGWDIYWNKTKPPDPKDPDPPARG